LGILDSTTTPALSIDPNNRILYASDGTTTALSWASGKVEATNGVKTAKIIAPADSTTAVGIFKADGTTNVLNVDTTNSRVGIGTTAPTRRLHVYTTDLSETPILIETDKATNYFGMKDTSGISYLSTISGAMRFMPLNVEKMRITTDGNVGIGTTAPGVKLHVSDGNALSAGLVTALSSWQSVSSRQAINAVGTLTASNTASERGISVFLRSRGTLASPTAVALDDYLGDLLFGGYDGSNPQYGGGVFAFVDGTVTSGSVPTRLSFVTGNSSTDRVERLTIKSDGNVGIGTTAPGEKLEVTGNIQLTSDNNILKFGTAEDAQVYYNGTDLIIDPKVVGTGVVNLNGGGLTTTGTGNFKKVVLSWDEYGIADVTTLDITAKGGNGFNTGLVNGILIKTSAADGSPVFGIDSEVLTGTTVGTAGRFRNTGSTYKIDLGTTGYSADAIGPFKLGYDASSNYLTITIDNSGNATHALTGTTPINKFSQAIKGEGGFQSSDGTAGITDANAGTTVDVQSKDGLVTTVTRVTPIADGTYCTGIGGTTNGSITVANGIITAITEAVE
jgi:hypothetical protein